MKSAGGGGFLFEDLVGAYVAAAMLSQNSVIGGLGPPVRICFQVGIRGWVLDDMLVSFQSKRKGTRRWAVSIRDRQREFRGGPSGEFVKKAWREVLGCTASDFNPNQDYVGMVIPPLHRDTKSDLEELLKLAEEQDAERPESRIEHGEPVSGSKRRLWNRFRKPGNSDQLPTSPDYLLQRFKYLDLDLNEVNSLDRDKAVGFCQEALASDGGGEDLWDALLAETARALTRGGYLDRTKLIGRLGDRFDFRDDKRTDPVYIEQMRRSSRARMIERWCAVGLSEEAAEQMAEDSSVGRFGGEIPDEGVVVLSGDFGSGKSLAAERVHLEDVTAYAVSNDEAIPVFLRARRAMGGLEESLHRALPSGVDIFGRSFRLVLDGLDEVGFSRGAELLEESRILARSRPGSRVLITARPGLRLREEEKHPMPELSDDALSDLSERLIGRRFALFDVPHPVKDAIRYPLFAIIALQLQSKHAELPSSRALFLDTFVKQSLHPKRDDIMSSLNTLAEVATLSLSGSGVLRESDIEPDEIAGLLATQMVVRDNNALRFALPVFEQYFGAYAILRGHVPIEEIVRDLRSFEAWRYAFVIAVGIGTWEKISDLIETLGDYWPGAACWVVNQAISERGGWVNVRDDIPSSFRATKPSPPQHLPSRRREDWLPDSLECAKRLQRSLAAWARWLKEIAPLTGIVDSKGKLATVGACRHNGTVTAGIGFGESLPNGAAFGFGSPGDVAVSPDAFALRTWGSPPLGETGWPWRWAMQWMTRKVQLLLQGKRLPIPPDGPLRLEYDWDLARSLGGDSRNPDSVDPQHVIQKGQRMLSYGDDNSLSSYSFDGKTIGYLELSNFILEAKNRQGLPFPRPWPSPDNPPDQWASSGLYSREAMRDLIKDRYMAALTAYAEISQTWFPRWVPTMGWGATMPIRLDLKLIPPQPMHIAGRGGQYGLELKETPADEDEGLDVTVSVVDNDPPRADWEELQECYALRMKQLRSLHPQTADWAQLTFHSTQRLHHSRRTPVTNLAYEWICRDLHEIGLLDQEEQFYD